MAGTFALVGGGEFGKGCDEMDRALIALAGGPLARIGILPTAAAREQPRLAVRNGVRHFNRLNGRAEVVMVVSRADADSPAFASQVDELAMAYLTGGDPIYLLETLQGSEVGAALLRLAERGGVLAGSSAGAMVLGKHMWEPGEGWREGLGAVPNLAVLPHHATLSARWNAEQMRSGLPEGVLLAGLDECTGLVGNGESWQAAGSGEVTLYRGATPEVYRAGEQVALGTG